MIFRHYLRQHQLIIHHRFDRGSVRLASLPIARAGAHSGRWRDATGHPSRAARSVASCHDDGIPVASDRGRVLWPGTNWGRLPVCDPA
jgi:hypothetical protein